MGVGGLIEISGRLEEPVMETLVLAAYGAARHRPVALAVPKELRDRVDRMLDRAVARFGVHRAGVFYVFPEDEPALGVARAADLVVATSRDLRARLDDVGITHRSPAEGLALLPRSEPDPPPPVSSRSTAKRTPLPAPAAGRRSSSRLRG